jgi:hypothetical protein
VFYKENYEENYRNIVEERFVTENAKCSKEIENLKGDTN